MTSSGARARGVEKLVHGRTCQQVVMRRHRTCVHRRARWRAPPWGTQRRTRHRRMTTVSSTSRFRRRRRPLSVRWLRARHAKEARAAAKTSYGSNADLARPTDKSPTKASVRPKRSTSVGAKAQSASHHRVKVDGVGDAARRDRAGQRRVETRAWPRTARARLQESVAPNSKVKFEQSARHHRHATESRLLQHSEAKSPALGKSSVTKITRVIFVT